MQPRKNPKKRSASINLTSKNHGKLPKAEKREEEELELELEAATGKQEIEMEDEEVEILEKPGKKEKESSKEAETSEIEKNSKEKVEEAEEESEEKLSTNELAISFHDTPDDVQRFIRDLIARRRNVSRFLHYPPLEQQKYAQVVTCDNKPTLPLFLALKYAAAPNIISKLFELTDPHLIKSLSYDKTLWHFIFDCKKLIRKQQEPQILEYFLKIAKEEAKQPESQQLLPPLMKTKDNISLPIVHAMEKASDKAALILLKHLQSSIKNNKELINLLAKLTLIPPFVKPSCLKLLFEMGADFSKLPLHYLTKSGMLTISSNEAFNLYEVLENNGQITLSELNELFNVQEGYIPSSSWINHRYIAFLVTKHFHNVDEATWADLEKVMLLKAKENQPRFNLDLIHACLMLNPYCPLEHENWHYLAYTAVKRNHPIVHELHKRGLDLHYTAPVDEKEKSTLQLSRSTPYVDLLDHDSPKKLQRTWAQTNTSFLHIIARHFEPTLYSYLEKSNENDIDTFDRTPGHIAALTLVHGHDQTRFGPESIGAFPYAINIGNVTALDVFGFTPVDYALMNPQKRNAIISYVEQLRLQFINFMVNEIVFGIDGNKCPKVLANIICDYLAFTHNQSADDLLAKWDQASILPGINKYMESNGQMVRCASLADELKHTTNFGSTNFGMFREDYIKAAITLNPKAIDRIKKISDNSEESKLFKGTTAADPGTARRIRGHSIPYFLAAEKNYPSKKIPKGITFNKKFYFNAELQEEKEEIKSTPSSNSNKKRKSKKNSPETSAPKVTRKKSKSYQDFSDMAWEETSPRNKRKEKEEEREQERKIEVEELNPFLLDETDFLETDQLLSYDFRSTPTANDSGEDSTSLLDDVDKESKSSTSSTSLIDAATRQTYDSYVPSKSSMDTREDYYSNPGYVPSSSSSSIPSIDLIQDNSHIGFSPFSSTPSNLSLFNITGLNPFAGLMPLSSSTSSSSLSLIGNQQNNISPRGLSNSTSSSSSSSLGMFGNHHAKPPLPSLLPLSSSMHSPAFAHTQDEEYDLTEQNEFTEALDIADALTKFCYGGQRKDDLKIALQPFIDELKKATALGQIKSILKDIQKQLTDTSTRLYHAAMKYQLMTGIKDYLKNELSGLMKKSQSFGR